MKQCPHPAWIEIDLKQFRANIAQIRQRIGGSRLCLPVKANAYGHGLVAMGKAAAEAGVDYLAVAHLAEGAILRNAGVNIPILVLGAIHEDQIEDLIEHQLEFSISSKFKANIVSERWKGGNKCRVHIEVDTGMQRTGVRPSTAIELYQQLKKDPCFEVVGIYSHLASADEPHNPFVFQQIEHFTSLLNHFKGDALLCHLANSGGVLHYPTAYFDMVRPSLLAFGAVSNPGIGIGPCFSLKAKVSYFKVVEKGQGISYGHSYVTKEKTRIVTIPVGYGDGFRRALSNKGHVLIRGKRFPIVGKICMDQFMVDVGDQEVYVGDEAVLIGKQGNGEISLREIADLCDTIPYEILCLFNERIPREYHG